jgi:hypothetical protein
MYTAALLRDVLITLPLSKPPCCQADTVLTQCKLSTPAHLFSPYSCHHRPATPPRTQPACTHSVRCTASAPRIATTPPNTSKSSPPTGVGQNTHAAAHPVCCTAHAAASSAIISVTLQHAPYAAAAGREQRLTSWGEGRAACCCQQLAVAGLKCRQQHASMVEGPTRQRRWRKQRQWGTWNQHTRRGDACTLRQHRHQLSAAARQCGGRTCDASPERDKMQRDNHHQDTHGSCSTMC